MRVTDWEYLLEAAESGNADAQLVLGLCYRYGWEVEVDQLRSVFWLQKAANRGAIFAAFLVGDAFERGAGVPQDAASAFAWISKAAAANLVVAVERLAAYYAQGFGADVDVGKAKRLLEAASRLGGRDARRQVADDLRAEGRSTDRELLQHYEKAAAMGDAESAFRAAQIYEADTEAAANAAKALALYQRAAELGFWYANNHLAIIYQKGLLGQKPDPGKVRELMRRSALALSAVKRRLEEP